MNIWDATAADKLGMAQGFTDDGLVRAEVTGPLPCRSKRKKRKSAKNMTFVVFSPPTRPDRLYVNTRVARVKMGSMSQDVKTEMFSLNWQPRDRRDAITRLADLA